MPDDFMKDKNTIPDEPKRNQRNPLVERVIIVDESSMVAPSMYRFLMNALGRGSVIRFFGDNNQLAACRRRRAAIRERAQGASFS
jgi:ATP-dependent exoDNAse (exonuclease V) alpha subunit